ncbi:MAG: hypothetical protein GQ577_10535 [Woeseiaceae bacterium]|jgi:hypothetical protein|nr:hypothetical protein [Woeseiaceae bacterium]
MTRSPLFYPLSRGMDSEAGGVADLQTDVMRFMAILALCLVAIFALVQSIPVNTVAPEIPAADVPAAVATPEPAPVPAPEPVTVPDPVPEPEVLESVVATPPKPAMPKPDRGFTLKFETDLALTRLVARNEVGLYAIGLEKSLRMNVNRGRLSFWPASIPNEFHEMDAATVPEDVVLALRRSMGLQSESIKWGVTLPPDMQDQLTLFMNTAESGTLLITARGDVQLEQ